MSFLRWFDGFLFFGLQLASSLSFLGGKCVIEFPRMELNRTEFELEHFLKKYSWFPVNSGIVPAAEYCGNQSVCFRSMESTQPKYIATPPASAYQHSINESSALLVPEVNASSYQFDDTACGGREIDDITFGDDAVFVSRRSVSCCSSSVENSVVKTKEIISADITTRSSYNTIFKAWILFGCLGHHRFCHGRRISGIAMFLCFAIGIAFTVPGYLLHGINCIVEDNALRCSSNYWQPVGIAASVLLAVTVLWWFYDLFLIRQWT